MNQSIHVKNELLVSEQRLQTVRGVIGTGDIIFIVDHDGIIGHILYSTVSKPSEITPP